MKKAKNNIYKKPNIKSQKIRTHFYSNRVFDIFDTSLLAGNSNCSGGGGGGGYSKSGSCFLAGTPILLSGYNYQSINQVKPGDMILSWDFRNKMMVNNRVKKLLIHDDIREDVFCINDYINVTGNHEFWIEKGSWIRVDKLRIGDVVYGVGGEKVKIKSIKKLSSNEKVYNLKGIKRYNNYFAGDFLVIS